MFYIGLFRRGNFEKQAVRGRRSDAYLQTYYTRIMVGQQSAKRKAVDITTNIFILYQGKIILL